MHGKTTIKIPRNSDLIHQNDYICSHGLTFVTNHYHAASDNLSRHSKSSSCYLEVTIEYVRYMFIICV
jgi:gamma-glutamylcysteine synthetase